ncbi:MAG: hypothetical protein NVS4B12_18460 [Ktedonobacteraceae bacterium]
MAEDRYYVQRLTEQVFVIRDRVSVNKEPGSNDPIVKSFDTSHDAYVYLDSVNNKQRTLDAEKREA